MGGVYFYERLYFGVGGLVFTEYLYRGRRFYRYFFVVGLFVFGGLFFRLGWIRFFI